MFSNVYTICNNITSLNHFDIQLQLRLPRHDNKFGSLIYEKSFNSFDKGSLLVVFQSDIYPPISTSLNTDPENMIDVFILIISNNISYKFEFISVKYYSCNDQSINRNDLIIVLEDNKISMNDNEIPIRVKYDNNFATLVSSGDIASYCKECNIHDCKLNHSKWCIVS